MKKSKKGFTLVELLVVIAIIAIIAAVAVPVTIGQINKSKIKTAQNEAQNAFDAIELGLASEGLTGLDAYLEANFGKPEYIRTITYDSGESTLTVTATDGVTVGDLDENVITFTVPADYASMISAVTTIVWDGAGNVTINQS